MPPTTRDLHLPGKALTHVEVLATLANAGVLGVPADLRMVNAHVAAETFFRPSGIATFTAWALDAQRRGKQIYLKGDPRVLSYLARMDVFRALSLPHREHFQRHAEGGRFTPVQLIEDERSVVTAVNAVCDMVLSQFDDVRGLLPALEWAVAEIVDNVRLHAASPSAGVLMAQYYEQTRHLYLAIVDRGVGIRQSLGASHPTATHAEAIRTAWRRGVTRDLAVGQGNGLAGARDIARVNGGQLELWTGDASVRAGGRRVVMLPYFQGTGVRLMLDVDRPVDLRQTFIQEPAMHFIEVENDRIAETGGLWVHLAVPHCLSREVATPLRRKVLNLLPDADAPLVLNFKGVEMATSSFMDELLGRMAAELGLAAFQQQVRLVGLRADLRAMAEVVIAQRLDNPAAASDTPISP